MNARTYGDLVTPVASQVPRPKGCLKISAQTYSRLDILAGCKNPELLVDSRSSKVYVYSGNGTNNSRLTNYSFILLRFFTLVKIFR